jgi:hypothetical protein
MQSLVIRRSKEQGARGHIKVCSHLKPTPMLACDITLQVPVSQKMQVLSALRFTNQSNDHWHRQILSAPGHHPKSHCAVLPTQFFGV